MVGRPSHLSPCSSPLVPGSPSPSGLGGAWSLSSSLRVVFSCSLSSQFLKDLPSFCVKLVLLMKWLSCPSHLLKAPDARLGPWRCRRLPLAIPPIGPSFLLPWVSPSVPPGFAKHGALLNPSAPPTPPASSASPCSSLPSFSHCWCPGFAK